MLRRKLKGETMAHYEGSYLVMSEEEIDALIERCQRPEVIQKRDAFFAELDQMIITRNPDGSMEVEFTPEEKGVIERMKEDVYNLLCVGCWREKLCHEDMEFCDAYLDATEEDDCQ